MVGDAEDSHFQEAMPDRESIDRREDGTINNETPGSGNKKATREPKADADLLSRAKKIALASHSSEKGASQVDSSDKAHKEPSFNAQPGPEQLYFGYNDSGSDLSLLGLSFAPSHNRENTHRTVIISGLPRNMALVAVLNKIRGGAIEDSGLLGPFSLEGINIARVVFVDEPSAQAFAENAADPSMFGSMKPVGMENSSEKIFAIWRGFKQGPKMLRNG